MAKFGEVSWEDDSDSNFSERKQNDKDIWLKLDEGSNVVRLVTKPFQYVSHKGVKKKGEKGYGQKVYCSNPDGKGSCPACDLGYKSGQRYLLGVLNSKLQYKILDISYQVHSQIKKLVRKVGVWGDPTKYDIDIVVDKKGGPTGYYSVQPIPHKPLSPEGVKEAGKADLVELNRKVTPPTVEQTQKRLDKILEGQPAEIPPPPPGKTAAKSEGKKSSAPEIVNDEEDSVNDLFPDYDANNA